MYSLEEIAYIFMRISSPIGGNSSLLCVIPDQGGVPLSTNFDSAFTLIALFTLCADTPQPILNYLFASMPLCPDLLCFPLMPIMLEIMLRIFINREV